MYLIALRECDGTKDETSAASVFDLAASHYMISRVVQACAHLGVFSQLSSEALDVKALAQKCGVNMSGMRALLTALHSLDIVQSSEGKWQLNPVLDGQLPDESMLAGLVGGYKDWLTLEEAVRTGQATVEPSFHRDPATLQQFLISMHFSSLPVARDLASHLPVPSPRQILDVGGGIGTYAATICTRYPDAKAVVLELPQVVHVGERLLARARLGHRVRFIAGDYLAVPFPPGNDLILMCNILHQERPASVRTLFRKAAEALTEEGWLIIHETLLDDQGPPPLPVALAALNNLLYYGGKSHHEYQILKWLKTSGFYVHQIQRAEQPGVRLITAQRASS